MDKKIEDFLTYTLYGILVITLIFMAFDNIKDPWCLIMLSAVFFALFTFRYVISDSNKASIIDFLLVIEVLMVYIIGRVDRGSSYMMYYFCIGASVILIRGKAAGLLVTIMSYGAYVVGLFYKLDGQPLWNITLKSIYDILGFISVYIFAALLRYVIVQNTELGKVTKELKLKTFEQQETYNRLLNANRELEELAILKERNRMAREIHDTIGHRLTTAIVEMEAGKTIFPKEKDEALSKFLMAKQQVQGCLEEIRISVRALQSGEMNDFTRAVKELIESVEKHTGIKIKYQIDIDNNLVSNNILKTLYRVVQEGITNGIRHGESTLFVLKINKDKENVKLILQDNGKGCSCVVKGFGLRAMEERINEVKGTLIIESEEEEGFTLKVTIPLV